MQSISDLSLKFARGKYMFSSLKISAFVGLIVLLASCGGMGWSNPSKTASEFYGEKYECEQNAARMYPPQNVNAQPTYNINCQNLGGGSASCTTTTAQVSQYDINVNNRLIAFSSCMQARGWKWNWKQ